MEISRAAIHLQIKNLSSLITPKIISLLNPCKTFDPKVLALADGSSAMFLAQPSDPKEIAKTIAIHIIFYTLTAKATALWQKAPKPLSELSIKITVLTAYSFVPAIAVKLALYAIRKNAHVDMNNRKERTLYIISSIALSALLTPYILKIHKRTYSYSTKGLVQYSLTQMTVHIVVAELFVWNDKKVAEEVKNTSFDLISSIQHYHKIGPETKAVIKRKNEEAQTLINKALVERGHWMDWMDEFSIEKEKIHLPMVPKAAFALFIQNHPELLENLSIEKQLEWNQCFLKNYCPLVWPIPLTQEHITFISRENVFLFHDYFVKTPFFFLLSEADRLKINNFFTALNSPFQDLTSINTFTSLPLPAFTFKHLHQFYSHQSEDVAEEYRWNSLSFKEKMDLNNSFMENGLSQLPYF